MVQESRSGLGSIGATWLRFRFVAIGASGVDSTLWYIGVGGGV